MLKNIALHFKVQMADDDEIGLPQVRIYNWKGNKRRV